MATITGKVYYSQDGYSEIITSPKRIYDSGTPALGEIYVQPQKLVPDIPIVLINSDGKGICVLTDSSGVFTFTNVPAGTYKLIEAFYQPDPLTSPQNFQANTITTPVPRDPTVDFITSKGLVTNGGTTIVSLTRNTYTNIAINSTNINKTLPYNFMDTPVINVPLILNYIAVGPNLVNYASKGTFGTLPNGSPESNSPAAAPYSEPPVPTGADPTKYYDTQMNYVQYGPVQPDSTPSPYHSYSISNILTKHTFQGKWFDTPAHNTLAQNNVFSGDETDRMLVVNGDLKDGLQPYFFSETVTVKPNTSYLFSAWIMNIFRFKKSALPTFTVTVSDKARSKFFEEDVTKDRPLSVTLIPTWKQIGAIIPATEISNSTEITITFISTGPEAIGNDYCVDDIILKELIPSALTPPLTKAVDKSEVSIDEEFEYTVTLKNITSSHIYDCIFIDPLPDGTELAEASDNLDITLNQLTSDPDVVTPIYNTKITINASDLSDGKNISEELKDNIPSTAIYYNFFKDGFMPYGSSLILKYKIKVTDINKLGNNRIVYNTARFDYSATFDTNEADFPRTVVSNEVQTKVKSSELSIGKTLSIQQGENEKDLPNGTILNCGDNIIYKIIVKNTGTESVSSVSVSDVLKDYLWPKNNSSNPKNWYESITKDGQIVPAGDITIDKDDANKIIISNINIAPNKSCTIRIFCTIKC